MPSPAAAQCPFRADPTPAQDKSIPRGKLPPALPGGWPWLGHAGAFARDPIGLLQRGREEFGEAFRFKLAGRDVYALLGPAANAAFFRAPDDQLSAREAYRFTVPIFGRGIAYDVEPEVMSEQVGFIMPALRESRLRTYTEAIAEEAKSYFGARWQDSGEVDLLGAMNELTIFIASRCLIGPEFRNRLTGEFAQLYRTLEGGINLIAFLWPYFPRPAHRRRDRARERMVELISSITDARRASGQKGEDFLQTLMEARYKDGRGLTHREIAGLLLTLVFAGQHTSAILAAWTVILLLQVPDYLARVRAEVDLWERAGGGYESLRELHSLERAMKEAERMFPPLVMLMRTIRRDFSHGPYRMPAGGMALISPAVSHRIPEVFPNPDRYDPERFSPDRAEDRRTPHSLIAFGGGRHRCAGAAFAYLQVKVIVSVLLRRYDLALTAANYTPDYHTWVVGPQSPCLIKFRTRRP
ncbi:MAG: cytochrome P450 [Chthoniobacterales bacterium]